jgi:hypothetical protein
VILLFFTQGVVGLLYDARQQISASAAAGEQANLTAGSGSLTLTAASGQLTLT